VLPLVGAALGAGPAALGVVLGAFLLGVGIFQLPAGFAAIRFGSRAVSVAGLATMGLASLASAFAPDVAVLAATRFVAGTGAAFFFAPGLTLISRHFPIGERGPIIGWYNGAFSVGGAAGLFGGALAGEYLGWPFALGIGGVLLLPAAYALLGRGAGSDDDGEGRARSANELWRHGGGVLGSRSVWALAFALTGFWSAVYVVAQYLVEFAHDARPAWGIGAAAALAAGVVILSFPGGPVGGYLAERSRDPRHLLYLFAGLTGLLVLAIPFAPIYVVAPALLLLGFFDGLVFAVQYVLPTYFRGTVGEGLALSIAFLNSVQVLVGSGLAIVFGLLVASHGYTVAWVAASLLTLATLPLLLFVERVVPGRAPPGVVAAGAPAPPG
jgi:MFS family permease